MKYLNLGSLSLGESEPQPIIIMQEESTSDYEAPFGNVYNDVVVVQGNTPYLYDKTPDGDDVNWAEVIIDNDGPGSLYYSINHRTRPAVALNAGQHIKIDLKRRGAIQRIYLRSDAGTFASVNLHAIG
jgi:hypothetical protein